MTLTAQNTAEGGTNGSGVATGGTGSGNAWDSVANTSNVITYDNTHVANGSMAYKVAMTGAVCRMSWTSTTLGTTTERYYAADFYFTGSPTSSCHVLEGVTSGSVQSWALDIASTGHFFIRNTSNTNVYTSTNALPVNSYCRVEVHVVAGTPGTIQVRLFAANTDTTVFEDSGAISTNTGADLARFDTGAMTASTALPAYWVDNIRVGDAAGSWLGPASNTYSAASTMTSGTSMSSSATDSGQNATAMTSGTALTGAPSAILAAGSAMTSATMLGSSPYTPIGARLVLGGVQWIAWRGGYASTLGECTLEAYQAAAARLSTALLEISVWQCASGEYVCSHDRTTGRVFSGPSVDITATTWSALSSYTTIAGGNPIRRLTDVLDALPHRLFVIDNKQDTNAAALIAVLEAHVPGRWMGKQAWTAYATWLTACQNAGAPVWAYFYPTDMPSGSTANLTTTLNALSPAKSPVVFGLGDYSASPVPAQADADAFFGFTTAHGLLTWAHIIGTAGQKSTADGQASVNGTAFNGYMTSGFATLAPSDGQTSAMTSGTGLTSSAALGAQSAAAMTSGTALNSQPALTAAVAGTMLSTTTLSSASAIGAAASSSMATATTLTGSAGLGAQVAGAMLSSTALASSATIGEQAGSVLVSPTSLGGAPTLGAQDAGAMTSATVLAGAAELISAVTGLPPLVAVSTAAALGVSTSVGSTIEATIAVAGPDALLASVSSGPIVQATASAT